MAFPEQVQITFKGKAKVNKVVSESILISFPFSLTPERLAILSNILTDQLAQATIPPAKEQQSQQLAQIAQTLRRFASNEPTAYESGTVRTSATGSANLLERQIERAITQVLGRAPGRGPEGFMTALKGAFPSDTSGQVVFTPTRSIVSIYSPSTTGTGLSGQLSVDQANLYRQASLILGDGLRILEGLKPFSPKADLEAVEALRTLIHSELNSMGEEFGRWDEPRPGRVETYLNALKDHLDKLGEMGGFPCPCKKRLDVYVPPVTADDEAQLAGYQLLLNYVTFLSKIWDDYKTVTPVEQSSGRYTEKLSRASILLPVIGDSNTSFMAAMDSIGFTESERRSDAARFSLLNKGGLLLNLTESKSGLSYAKELLDQLINKLQVRAYVVGYGTDEVVVSSVEEVTQAQLILPPSCLPDITVNDLNDWIDRFTRIESPAILATSGRYGLESVIEQAHTLFWIILLILSAISWPSAAETTTYETMPLLKQVLSYERVKQSLSELFFQLKALADLTK